MTIPKIAVYLVMHNTVQLINRKYHSVLAHHLQDFAQMIFLTGPRQSGKTTLARHMASSHRSIYLNWDITTDREKILSPPAKLIQDLRLDVASIHTPLIILDEIHKYTQWKSYLKGLYDYLKWHQKIAILVTGSARLDVYKKGGDSLMGRYFPYRIHPLSVSEVNTSNRKIHINHLLQDPMDPSHDVYDTLWRFGGFPEPFLRQNQRFHTRWNNLRTQQLFREDIRETNDIKSINQLEVLAYTLQQQTGQLVNYTSLSRKIRVSDKTIQRWISVLEAFFFCFRIAPWSRNIPRSLLKEPKIYLWDWSMIHDAGNKFENFIASHLHKACHFWTDAGMGQYELFFLRTKEGKEVDFLITQNNVPWMLVEAKLSDCKAVSKSLAYFHRTLATQYAFQVIHHSPYIDQSCFTYTTPTIVSAKTFLSQLV